MYTREALQGRYANRVTDISAQLITDASNAKILFVSDTIVDICNNIITAARDISDYCLYYCVTHSPYFDECVGQIISGVKTMFDVSVSVITLQDYKICEEGYTIFTYIKNDYINTNEITQTKLYVNYASGERTPTVILNGALDKQTGVISGGIDVTNTINITSAPCILVEWA